MIEYSKINCGSQPVELLCHRSLGAYWKFSLHIIKLTTNRTTFTLTTIKLLALLAMSQIQTNSTTQHYNINHLSMKMSINLSDV